MQNKFKIAFFATFIILALTSVYALASMVAPYWLQNEEMNKLENPHPPQTDEDKKRVAFAETVVNQLLKTAVAHTPTVSAVTFYESTGYYFNLDAACFQQPACLQNKELQKYLNEIFTQLGSVVEFKNAHIIPWAFDKFKNQTATASAKPEPSLGVAPPESQHKNSRQADQPSIAVMPSPVLLNDEYMIHIYTKLTNQHWYHLDVIVSEDAKGKITFRRFFFIEVPLENSGHSMPPGTVC